MALTLNTNIDSLTAQNNLTGSQALLSQSLTRLSSGLRINSAADDAAGLAISTQFTTQVNGTNQAINNANDAVSEAQTAGGALTTIVNNLQSIRTLAVEAANGSNSSADRQALDAQVQQQIAEVTQIAQQTTFNGLSVLNGSSGTTTYQVGANVGNTISINLAQGVAATQIGAVASNVGEVTTGATTGSSTIAVGSNTAVTIGSSTSYATTATTTGANAFAYQNSSSAYAKAAAINGSNVAGLTALATNSQDVSFGTVTVGTGGTTEGSYTISVNGVQVLSATGSTAGTTVTAAQVVTAINSFSSQTGGVTAAAGTAGHIILTAADGSTIQLADTFTAGTGGTVVAGTGGITSAIAYNPASGTSGADLTGATAEATAASGASLAATSLLGQITLSAGQNIAITGADATLDGQAIGVITATGTLAGNNVLTVNGANNTIQAVDSALATVSAFQSQLGSIQNRFTAAVSNLTSTAQNLTQSRSTIQDANFAQETANLTQAQVLEQAGISVLAQANQEPQLILKLLS
jgi:flagellin